MAKMCNFTEEKTALLISEPTYYPKTTVSPGSPMQVPSKTAHLWLVGHGLLILLLWLVFLPPAIKL
jgi:hypothetical protein